MGHPGGPAGYRQDFPGYSQGPTYPGPVPLGQPTAQGGSALSYGPVQPYSPAQSFPSQRGPMQQTPFQQEAAPHGNPGFQPSPSGGHSPAPQPDLGRFQPGSDSDPASQQPVLGPGQSQPNFGPGAPQFRPDLGPVQPPPDFAAAQSASSDFGPVSSQSAAPHAHSAPQFGGGPGTPFDACLRRASSRLQAPFSYLPELSSYLMVTERMSAVMANMHQFFFFTQNDACNGALMHQFTSACVSWALHNYQGAPRGMMKGVAIYPVMCQTVANPEVIAFTKQKPDMHYSSFTLACSVELSTGRVEWMEKTPVYGLAMWNGVKKVAELALM